MSKAVRESIDHASRQANPEVTANPLRMSHDIRNLVQTSQWDLSINMQEPKDIAAGGARAGIHLSGATELALDELIAKSSSESSRAIGAPAIHDNDFSSGCSVAQMPKKWPYQRRFVKHWDDD
jgi:hypothetical protein